MDKLRVLLLCVINSIYFGFVLSSAIPAHAEKCLFAALSSMTKATIDEHYLLLLTENYTKSRIEKLDQLSRVLDKWKKVHKDFVDKKQVYKDHKVHQYALIKRLTKDWAHLSEKIFNKEEELKELKRYHYHSYMPKERDIRGLARLLVVNSRIYNKTVSELLNNGNQFISVNDFLELSYRIVHHKVVKIYEELFTKSAEVALFAFNKAKAEGKEVILKEHIWNHLKNVTDYLYQNRFWKLGYLISDAFLHWFPYDQEFSRKKTWFTERIAEDETSDRGSSLAIDVTANTDERWYQYLCRREGLHLPPENELRCYFTHKNRFLKYLSPYKAERLHWDPPVLLYHEMLTDNEISTMARMAFPRLDVARVFDPNNPNELISDDRISNNAWILTSDDPAVNEYYEKIHHKFEDSTGLDRFGSEGLQVNNYGIGGHYLWHFDALYHNAKDLEEYPNDRMGTFMFYLNDVLEGGNTVFMRLNLTVPPEKGAAVFWYNLHPSGLNDFRSLHAGCPILKGTKWVTNIWIREDAQMFTKPCIPEDQFEMSDWTTNFFEPPSLYQPNSRIE